jgi:catechol 2,3-dioxygenase-like lactoylglutathione lyase family enzyme
MIKGINQVLVEVDDQYRALAFWTERLGFQVDQDAPHGNGGRWLEVRTPDRAVTSRPAGSV